MATITLRPNSDISVGHNKYENGSSSSAAGYSLIDDVVSDEDATTIGQSHHSTSVTSSTSSFGLGGDDVDHKLVINSITLYYDYICDCSNTSKGGMGSIAITTTLTANGSQSTSRKNSISDVSSSSKTSWGTVLNNAYTPEDFSSLSGTFTSISELNLQFSITTEWACSSSSVTNNQYMYISQVYAVVDYTPIYTFTAVGNDTTDVTSPGDVKSGETATFEARPRLNHRFEGWYSDAGLSNLVSTSAAYSITSSADTTLYANSKRIEIVNVYYKKNGTWSLATNLYIKKNGTYQTLTAKEFGDALFFTDLSYMNLT